MFHTLKVVEIKKETADAVSVVLKVSKDDLGSFRFIPGQYITFKKEIDGEEVRRSYSICSAPYQNELRVGIKKMIHGKFSTFANDVLKVGDTLETMVPMGKFQFHSDANKTDHIVALAGGSGITPVLSILKDALRNQPKCSFTLFYGNRNAASIIFKGELEMLKNRYMDRLTVHHILSDEEVGSDLFQGMMTKEKVSELIGKMVDVKQVEGFYICGPEPMILGAKDVLKEAGVADENVHFELFGTAVTASLVEDKKADTATDQPKVHSTVKVVLDDDEFELELDSDGQTILEAATEAGIDVPFSCKGAVCCTCLARVKQGKVSMDKNYSLSEKEVAEGLVLTCQSHPRSKNVVVDFDDIW